MKRRKIILCVAFMLFLFSMLVPRGGKVIAKDFIVRTDFGWPIQSLSIYAPTPVESPFVLFSSEFELSDITLDFGTLLSYSFFVILLNALDKGSRKQMKRRNGKLSLGKL